MNFDRVMIHIVAQIHKADKMDMLEKYVKVRSMRVIRCNFCSEKG